ncbi:unnamed protein product [Arctia plantaginis]|uniref:Peptidyl-prolyl cis-trans isomerase n=1 Tax=Arctia plantaginis TaxID=874455 RepID=A0A8S0Z1V2_ARCPL|nr:unnamed protein product [Arctia plantaginis]
MSKTAPEDLPDGWEMHTAVGCDVVLYVNTLSKSWPIQKPKCPGGWTLTARSPAARVLPSHSPDATYAVPSSANSTFSDSASNAVMHRPSTSRGHSSNLPEEIRCSHILIKHNESRRPTSWRSDTIRRTKEEALVIARDIRAQIMIKENRFEDIAKVFSDCSSAKRHGDLGRFQRGQMQKGFEMVAFKLKVGQLSKPVETKSGIHLILRTL